MTGPTPQRASTGSFCRNALDPLGRDDGQAVRLLPARGDLGEKLVRRDAGRGRQPRLLADLRSSAAAPRRLPSGSPPGVLRDVEVRLVERERLDERRDRAEDREDLLRHGARTSRSRGGTITSRGHRRTARAIGHRRAHAEARAPRSSPPRRRRGSRAARRRPPACPRASDRRAARRTRRTRPCRRGGSCGPSGRGTTRSRLQRPRSSRARSGRGPLRRRRIRSVFVSFRCWMKRSCSGFRSGARHRAT